MDVQSCSLENVFNAKDNPLDKILSHQKWNIIKRTAPMLVRTINGKENDVRLQKEILLKYVRR